MTGYTDPKLNTLNRHWKPLKMHCFKIRRHWKETVQFKDLNTASTCPGKP
jgi:hypothetical protein